MGRPKEFIYHNNDYTFRVKQGDIFKEHADVMVVPAYTKVDPKYGLEKIVYEKAGKDALIAQRKKYPKDGELRVGELLETSALNLNNVKKLFHVVPPANRNQETELLEKCYEKCIELASNKHYQSLIVPLIGSKNMMFSVIDSYIAAKHSIERTLLSIKGKKPTVTLVVTEGALYYINAYENGNDIIQNYDLTGEPEEYAVRMQDMLKVIENKELSLKIYINIKKEKEANSKKYKNYAKNKYAAMLMSGIMRTWLDKQSKDGTTRNKSISDLETITNISKSAIKSILSPEEKNNSYITHDRKYKIRLAVAMKLKTEDRYKFIMVDDNEALYPYSEFEKHLELVLAELNGSGKYGVVKEMLKQKGFELDLCEKINNRKKTLIWTDNCSILQHRKKSVLFF